VDVDVDVDVLVDVLVDVDVDVDVLVDVLVDVTVVTYSVLHTYERRRVHGSSSHSPLPVFCTRHAPGVVALPASGHPKSTASLPSFHTMLVASSLSFPPSQIWLFVVISPSRTR